MLRETKCNKMLHIKKNYTRIYVKQNNNMCFTYKEDFYG